MATTKMEIIEISPVGVSRFAGSMADKCYVCMNNTMSLCGSCSVGETDQSECKIIVGGCSHAYHLHCYRGVIAANPHIDTCIYCKAPWNLAKIVDLTSTS